MKLRIHVTVNKETSWAEWNDEKPTAPQGGEEQEEWVKRRALFCFRRSLTRLQPFPAKEVAK